MIYSPRGRSFSCPARVFISILLFFFFVYFFIMSSLKHENPCSSRYLFLTKSIDLNRQPKFVPFLLVQIHLKYIFFLLYEFNCSPINFTRVDVLYMWVIIFLKLYSLFISYIQLFFFFVFSVSLPNKRRDVDCNHEGDSRLLAHIYKLFVSVTVFLTLSLSFLLCIYVQINVWVVFLFLFFKYVHGLCTSRYACLQFRIQSVPSRLDYFTALKFRQFITIYTLKATYIYLMNFRIT